VVGDHFRVVLGPAKRLDPLGHNLVLPGSVGPWDLAVRDVSDEDVPERPLAVAGDRGGLRTRYELFALERAEAFLD
jgi:hypothetical protein